MVCFATDDARAQRCGALLRCTGDPKCVLALKCSLVISHRLVGCPAGRGHKAGGVRPSWSARSLHAYPNNTARRWRRRMVEKAEEEASLVLTGVARRVARSHPTAGLGASGRQSSQAKSSNQSV